MNRLTPFSRLLLTVGIVLGVFFAFKKIGPKFGFGAKTPTSGVAASESASNNGSATTNPLPNEAQNGTAAPKTGNNLPPAPATPTPANKPVAPPANTGARPKFIYNNPTPENGKLKGVVELGASGFNSFIINVDAQKNWELKKADFGASLVYDKLTNDTEIKSKLVEYITSMTDYGVLPKNVHFVISSGAQKVPMTAKIIELLKQRSFYVNTVTAEVEGKLGAKCVLPKTYEGNGFVVDIGSGNTKITWSDKGAITSLESFGAKYFQDGKTDDAVYADVKAKAAKVPAGKRETCFIIGGVPFELAQQVRSGKERYTVLNAPSLYNSDKAKTKSGINIYKAVADATGCKEFVFDWDANFTIGFLLGLNY
ncbi:MAG: hypothetical protein RIS64_3963 [Bacteroidota bacterium]|jgi:hypothetical protein